MSVHRGLKINVSSNHSRLRMGILVTNIVSLYKTYAYFTLKPSSGTTLPVFKNCMKIRPVLLEFIANIQTDAVGDFVL